MVSLKVLVFPLDSNPYQELLYAPMRLNGVRVNYLSVPNDTPVRAATLGIRLVLQLLLRRLQGYKILHIHWLYSLGAPEYIPFSKQITLLRTKFFLLGARLCGYSIVWTAHNVLPHKPVTSNDLAIRKQLARLAKLVILHSNSTKRALVNKGIKAQSWAVIPHGNYVDSYKNDVTALAARKQLKLPVTATVIAFLGNIDPYKNIPQLIESFVALAELDTKLHLILAGRCNDDRVPEVIDKHKEVFKNRIQFHDSHVANDQIQIFLNAADFCVFPFTEVTTSGSVLLALSFAKPVVAPLLGALEDLPKAVGILYDPIKQTLPLALKNMLSKQSEWEKMSDAAADYAATLNWEKISQQTVQCYETILARTNKSRN